MQSVSLIRHPFATRSPAHRITTQVTVFPRDSIEFRYELEGNIDGLRNLVRCPSRRGENLWQHTCFEAFIVARRDGGYFEFNFAPSGEWAIYHFDSYRNGMKVIDATPSFIMTRRTAQRLTVDVTIGLNQFPDLKNQTELRLALSAVIEDNNGALSYWALAHPPGKPDFHHRDSFALTLNPLKSSL